ncbi:MAG: phosphatase PAP2 family protein [Bacteroidia bacterium]
MSIKKNIISLAALFYIVSANAQIDSLPNLTSDTSSIEKSTPAPAPDKKDARNGKIYYFNPWVDIPVIAAGCAWSAFAFPKIYSKDPSTEAEISSLDKNDIPSFDRWAAGKSNKTADNTSDYFMYGSVFLPFTLLADNDIRHDAGRVGLLYLEAMSITGLLYSGSVYFVDRYRPETYNTTIPVGNQLSGNNKDSFIGGHPATVATTTFFTAKIYADYHPESNFKYVLYGVAVAATGTTVYLRHIAGKHFPSDLLLGTTVGTLSGILVPHFHKNKPVKDRSLGIIPFSNGTIHGIGMTYKMK